MPFILLLTILFFSPMAYAQNASDDDISLARLSYDNGQWHVGKLQPVAHNKGYENQPSFSLDNSSIYYTAMDSEDKTDIWKYDLSSKKTSVLANSIESEFSPTEFLNETFSTVRIEQDDSQRLWRLKDGGFSVIYPEIKGVGYHAWLDEKTTALYILGEPNTLVLARLKTHGTREIASDTGRCIQRVPGMSDVSFVQKTAQNPPHIMQYNLNTRQTQPLIALLSGSEDFTWHPNGTLFQSDGNELFSYRPGTDKTWVAVKGSKDWNLKGMSRLAISHDGIYLAIVHSK